MPPETCTSKRTSERTSCLDSLLLPLDSSLEWSLAVLSGWTVLEEDATGVCDGPRRSQTVIGDELLGGWPLGDLLLENCPLGNWPLGNCPLGDRFLGNWPKRL